VFLATTLSSDWPLPSKLPCYPPRMEQHKFEFDHELAAQMRARHEKTAREAATAEYHRTTEWMLRVTAMLLLKIGVGIALLFVIGWLFLG